MKIIAYHFCLFFIFLFILTPTIAYTMTGKDILKKCTDDPSQLKNYEELLESMLCTGYVKGAFDVFVLLKSPSEGMGTTAENEKPTFCPPVAGIPADQLIRIVQTYIKKRPRDASKDLHFCSRC